MFIDMTWATAACTSWLIVLGSFEGLTSPSTWYSLNFMGTLHTLPPLLTSGPIWGEPSILTYASWPIGGLFCCSVGSSSILTSALPCSSCAMLSLCSTFVTSCSPRGPELLFSICLVGPLVGVVKYTLCCHWDVGSLYSLSVSKLLSKVQWNCGETQPDCKLTTRWTDLAYWGENPRLIPSLVLCFHFEPLRLPACKAWSNT